MGRGGRVKKRNSFVIFILRPFWWGQTSLMHIVYNYEERHNQSSYFR